MEDFNFIIGLIVDTLRLSNNVGQMYKDILTIKRTYELGRIKIVHKTVTY